MGFLAFLPLIQLLSNIGLTAAGLPGAASLATQFETALAPLFTAIGSKSATSTDIMAALGASIGVLTALKGKTSDEAVLAKINEYLGAVQDALATGITAEKGFDASLYTPVTEIQ